MSVFSHIPKVPLAPRILASWQKSKGHFFQDIFASCAPLKPKPIKKFYTLVVFKHYDWLKNFFIVTGPDCVGDKLVPMEPWLWKVESKFYRIAQSANAMGMMCCWKYTSNIESIASVGNALHRMAINFCKKWYLWKALL